MSRLIPIKTINGTNMAAKLQPAKEGYSVQKSDLYSDSTTRSAETGVLIPYLIRRDVYTIELHYVGTAAEIHEIEQIIAPTGGTRQYQVEFLDDTSYVTKTMYPSDRQKPVEVIIDGVPKMSLSFSLVEI